MSETWEWAPCLYLNLRVVSWSFLPLPCWATWWVPGGCQRSTQHNCLSGVVCAASQGSKLPADSRTECDNYSRDVQYDLVLSMAVFSFDVLYVGRCLRSVVSAAVTSNVQLLAEVYLWVCFYPVTSFVMGMPFCMEWNFLWCGSLSP